MPTYLKLLFSDFFTNETCFVIMAPITPPREGSKEAAIDKQYKWLAATGVKAKAKQRESGLTPIIGEVPEVTRSTYLIRFPSTEVFLKAINATNSSTYDVELLKRISWLTQTASLETLRRVLKPYGAIISAYSPD